MKRNGYTQVMQKGKLMPHRIAALSAQTYASCTVELQIVKANFWVSIARLCTERLDSPTAPLLTRPCKLKHLYSALYMFMYENPRRGECPVVPNIHLCIPSMTILLQQAVSLQSLYDDLSHLKGSCCCYLRIVFMLRIVNFQCIYTLHTTMQLVTTLSEVVVIAQWRRASSINRGPFVVFMATSTCCTC